MILNAHIHDQKSMGASIPMELPSGFSVLIFHFLFSTFHFPSFPRLPQFCRFPLLYATLNR
jgi:hypothetical protein